MQKEVYETFRKAREKAGLTRKELAAMIGCSDRAVQYWEDGQREITLVNADALCRALSIELVIGKSNKSAL
ncbi:MAG: helix-turn-helix transcriptional regulator [Clostridium sp.]|nr:helix-turn-helix transcriptional regulator [Clostridium sp.]